MVPLKTKNNKADKQKEDASSPVSQIVSPLLIGNHEYVSKPPLLEEKLRIYQSQVLIPLTIVGETHEYMGPLLGPNIDVEKLKEFFPFIIVQNSQLVRIKMLIKVVLSQIPRPQMIRQSLRLKLQTQKNPSTQNI